MLHLEINVIGKIWNWVENEDKYECFFAFSKIKSIFDATKNIWESIYLIPWFHACQNITFKYLPLFFIDDGDARYLIKKVLQREIIKTYWYYQMCYANSFILHYRSIQSISLFAMATYHTFDYDIMGAILFCKCDDVFPYSNMKCIERIRRHLWLN